MTNENEPIKVEATINASVAQVWVALTDLSQMKYWYFDNIPSFEPIVGFETRFKVAVADRTFTHMWKILEVVPRRMLSYEWKFEEYIGSSVSTFLIEEINDKVQLTLTAEVIHPFSSDIPEFSRESGVGGWNYFIFDRLVPFVEGQ